MEKTKRQWTRKLFAAAVAAVIFALVIVLFAGCAGTPDNSGSTEVQPPDVAPQVYSVTMTYNGKPIDSTLSVDIMIGTVKVSATVNKDESATGTLEYSSSDPSIAMIASDGTVTLVGVGETTLTASYGGKSFSALLVVGDGYVAKHAITVNGGKASVSTAANGDIITLIPVIPEHKQFVEWDFSDSQTTVTWINGNEFKMPNGDVQISAKYVDKLYTLQLVGATVTSAKTADGKELDINGEEFGYEGDVQTAEHAKIAYKYPFDAKLTLTAAEAPAGKMLVGWDENSLNNRRNDDMVIKDFSMPGESTTLWTVYSKILGTDLFWKNGKSTFTEQGFATWNDFITRIDGSESGADPDLQGFSGFRMIINRPEMVSAAGYNTDMTGSNFSNATRMASQTVKVIIKNRGAHDVTVEIYPNDNGHLAASGWITVPAGETVTTNFVALIGFTDAWWGFNLREYNGPTTIDMVLAHADAYPTGDRMISVQKGTELVEIDSYQDRVGGGLTVTANNTYGYSQGGIYEHYVSEPMVKTARLKNVPAYDENDPYLTVYVKFTNRATNEHSYTYSFGLGTDANPWDENEGWIKPSTKAVEFTVSNYGQTVLLALRVPRSSATEQYYLSFMKLAYDTPDGKKPESVKPWYALNMGYILTYNNGIGFDEGVDLGVGFGDSDPKVNSVGMEYDGEPVGDVLNLNMDDVTIKLDPVVNKDVGAMGYFRFESDNQNVATVDSNGKVKITGVGDAHITVSYGGKSFTTILRVGGTALVHSVTIRYDGKKVPETLTVLKSLETIKLDAEVVMDGGAPGTLEFTSTDHDVATVTDDGAVTLVGAGSAVITASYGDKSASVTLIVKQPAVHSVSATVNGKPLGSTYTVDKNDGTLELVAVIDRDEDAPSEIIYTSNNEAVATVATDGTVTVKGVVGECDITVSCGDKSFTTTLKVIDMTAATKYQVTVTGGTADVQEAAQGTIVTLTPDVVEHKTIDGWTGYSGDLEWTSVNTFIMPDSNVSLTPLYRDTLYTLKVVGGTVVAAKKADDSELELTGADGGYENDNETAEYRITEYAVPFGAKLTLTAASAPEGDMFVGWDVYANGNTNRRNDEALTYTMTGNATTVWTVYSTIISSNIFDNNTSMAGYNNYAKIDGTAANAKPEFYGYSGFSIEVPATVKVDSTSNDEPIGSNSNFNSQNGAKTVKLILRNRGATDITIEMGPKNGGTYGRSGWVKVPAGETVYHNFIVDVSLSSPWWGFNVREFDGSAAVTLDIVAAYGEAALSDRSAVVTNTAAEGAMRAQAGADVGEPVAESMPVGIVSYVDDKALYAKM